MAVCRLSQRVTASWSCSRFLPPPCIPLSAAGSCSRSTLVSPQTFVFQPQFVFRFRKESDLLNSVPGTAQGEISYEWGEAVVAGLQIWLLRIPSIPISVSCFSHQDMDSISPRLGTHFDQENGTEMLFSGLLSEATRGPVVLDSSLSRKPAAAPCCKEVQARGPDEW